MPAILLRLLPAMLALLVLTGCEQPQAQSTDAIRPVKLMTLQSANAAALRQFPARVEASTRSNLSFRMAGELLELNVSPGQRVSEGEVIARIDDRNVQSELDSARSRLQLAEATLERMRYTLQRGAVSQSQFDQSESEWRAARATFEQAQEQVEHTKLRAPYDGVIAQVPVDNRQIVQVQETVAVIQQPGQLDVVFHLPEQIVQRIPRSNGAPFGDALAFEVRFGKSDKPYLAQLASYTTQASAQSLAYEVTLTLPQPDDITLLDGMSANVRLDLSALQTAQTAPLWRLPPDAVSYSGDNPEQAQVWRFIEPHRVEAVPVEVGTLTSQGLEVTGDLSAGDRIVAAGAHRLTTETRVTPWEKEQGL
ncbi:efflux RND transporter periplasmic adaptor subunit [Halomonas alkaliantarctica]|uniref:Efflux RND transporter periplasmic adaptor subunit n=1 Tax=Halomonas alkaliantarctica TaxID=232346 RepID=A0ABY8LKR0_9GAMM|nr:efflux RND transporter periplasmic adaptor subunit [Halomonas alkaliantarctica]WGI25032.1 efflux RND transporter periplasmic adaptor subunit [Halomonas alkaliantarctica]